MTLGAESWKARHRTQTSATVTMITRTRQHGIVRGSKGRELLPERHPTVYGDEEHSGGIDQQYGWKLASGRMNQKRDRNGD